jgi:hypothetical protein
VVLLRASLTRRRRILRLQTFLAVTLEVIQSMCPPLDRGPAVQTLILVVTRFVLTLSSTCLNLFVQFTQAAPVPTLMQADQFRSLLLSSQRPCQVLLEKAVLPPDQLAALNQVLGCFSSIVCSGDL